jgi:hypothetical protein
MKPFRLPLFVLLIVALAVFLTACAPLAASGTVRGLAGLPEDAKTLVLVVITSLLTAAAAWVFTKFGIQFGGYVEPLSLALAGIVITLIESGLALIPPVFDDIVLAIIHALVLAAGGGFVLLLVRKVRAKATRTLLKA